MGGNIMEFFAGIGRLSRRSSGSNSLMLHKTGSETSIESKASTDSSTTSLTDASSVSGRSSVKVRKDSKGGDARWFTGFRRSNKTSYEPRKSYAPHSRELSKAEHERILQQLESTPQNFSLPIQLQ